MVDSYIPTTEEVRADYGSWADPDDGDAVSEAIAQFDRWLSAHDAVVALTAWDDGANFVAHHPGVSAEYVRDANPYRDEKERNVDEEILIRQAAHIIDPEAWTMTNAEWHYEYGLTTSVNKSAKEQEWTRQESLRTARAVYAAGLLRIPDFLRTPAQERNAQ